MICQIVAVARNGVIGRDGQLAWHLKPDLQFFKKQTTGYPIVMGRKTFESIGKPLPQRLNIVVSRTLEKRPDIEVVSSLDAAVAYAQKNSEKCFVIGGAQLYQAALPITDIIYLTRVHRDIEGDTYYPQEWLKPFRLTHESPTEIWEGIPYQFLTFERNS